MTRTLVHTQGQAKLLRFAGKVWWGTTALTAVTHSVWLVALVCSAALVSAVSSMGAKTGVLVWMDAAGLVAFVLVWWTLLRLLVVQERRYMDTLEVVGPAELLLS